MGLAMCGIVYNGLQGKEIVVAGGYGEDPDEYTTFKFLDQVEILSLRTMHWRNGSKHLIICM